MPISATPVAGWEFENNLNDVLGVSNLTQHNTPTYTAGKVGNAITFASASSQSVDRADNAALSMADIDFTIVFWCKPVGNASQGVLYKGDSTGVEYAITIRSSGVFRFEVDNGPGLANITQVESTTHYTTGVFNFCVCQHDSVNNLLKISVNNGAFDTAAYSLGSWDSGVSFYIGTDGDFGDFFNGSMDQVFIFKSLVNSTDLSFMYNSGSGRTYAEMVASAAGSTAALQAVGHFRG